MTAEQKQKFEGQIEMAIKPAMGNIQTILESVANVLGEYVKSESNIGWEKRAGGQFVITHNWGAITITNGVNPQFDWND